MLTDGSSNSITARGSRVCIECVPFVRLRSPSRRWNILVEGILFWQRCTGVHTISRKCNADDDLFSSSECSASLFSHPSSFRNEKESLAYFRTVSNRSLRTRRLHRMRFFASDTKIPLPRENDAHNHIAWRMPRCHCVCATSEFS